MDLERATRLGQNRVFTIGEWIFNHISNGISNLAGKFGNIGQTIIDAIVAGLKAAKNDVKDALDWVIGSYPRQIALIRKGLAIVGINLAEGGPVGGGYGGGDIVPAHLEPGEHVWTKEEVRSAGGHAAMYAMRSAFGAGGQGGGGRYAVGGGVSLPNQSQIDASVTLSTDPAFKQAVKFSNDFQTLWKKLWTAIEQTTVTATNFLTKQFTTLHDNVIKLITQVNNNVTGQFDTIRKQTTQDAQDLTQSIVQSLSNLDDAVSKSMEYVGTATNQALKTFNVKPVELNVDKPPDLPGSRQGWWRLEFGKPWRAWSGRNCHTAGTGRRGGSELGPPAPRRSGAPGHVRLRPGRHVRSHKWQTCWHRWARGRTVSPRVAAAAATYGGSGSLKRQMLQRLVVLVEDGLSFLPTETLLRSCGSSARLQQQPNHYPDFATLGRFCTRTAPCC